MRQFRGQRINTKEWAYGWYAGTPPLALIIPDNACYYYKGESDISKDCSLITNIIEVTPATVGQSTGLKDKNGVEIWENSRIRVLWDDGETKEYTVIWAEWDFCCDNFAYLPDTDQIEVIGNVHDNPELLHGRK